MPGLRARSKCKPNFRAVKNAVPGLALLPASEAKGKAGLERAAVDVHVLVKEGVCLGPVQSPRWRQAQVQGPDSTTMLGTVSFRLNEQPVRIEVAPDR